MPNTRLMQSAAVLAGWIMAAWNSAIEPVAMIRTNKRLSEDTNVTEDIRSLSELDLEKLVQDEGSRATQLDDKLQKLTATLSVTVAVAALAGQTILSDLAASGLKTAATTLFLVAAVLLMIGAYVGFDGLRPRMRFGYGAGFLHLVAKGGVEKRRELELAAAAFQRHNLIRANQTSAAVTLIRNGLLVFMIGTLVATIAANSEPAPKRASTVAIC